MVEKKQAEAAEQAPTTEPQEVHGEHLISQFEFIERVPTRDEVVALLRTLPSIWGIKPVDFADHVQLLPSSKKVKRPSPQNPNVKIDEYLAVYTPYMAVAGRLAMLQAAAECNGWCVDFEPEPFTPTGIPGYLAFGEEPSKRIVYREYCVIKAENDGSDPRSLGRKPGTAWVPWSGGSQAAGSNPFEKVETSARGRAIAAWGFGVLPGSGVASVEEIFGSRENKVAIDVEAAQSQGRGRGGNGQRKPREEMISETLMVGEELRQARGMTDEQMHERMVNYLTTSLGVKGAVTEDGKIDWAKVKDGQIQLTHNALRTSLREFRDEGSQV